MVRARLDHHRAGAAEFFIIEPGAIWKYYSNGSSPDAKSCAKMILRNALQLRRRRYTPLSQNCHASGYWLDALEGGTAREVVLATFSENAEARQGIVGIMPTGPDLISGV